LGGRSLCDPRRRRQGIGEQLVSRAITFAFSKGYKSVYFGLMIGRNWYEKLGWQLLEQYEHNNAVVSILKYEIAA